jgi:heat shock protein HslJ
MMNLTKTFLPMLLLSFFFLYACGGDPVELSDHKWKATSVTGTSPTKEKLSSLTLEFKEDQEVGGFSGCNEYRGGATYNQKQIKFSTLYTDSKSCEDAALERAFLKNLESAATYIYQGKKLAIQDEAGNILVEMEQM